ncbi:putative late blight resistance protein homolog R1A-4 [Salvia hispanica]|uniref:putative late blight resistance protein homolog R1A-4 n=1 Tax=Salvia hispanica TaxID=49212 RepID=UPI002009BA80|nr:putative late blight resistance protein homolog R1A-4 [Salvia hispanica]
MNTISNILSCSRFSLVGRSTQLIQFVYSELDPLQQILERLDKTSPSRSRKKVNALDGKIKEAVWIFEDALESLLTKQIRSQSQSLPFPEILFIDLQSLQNGVDFLIQALQGVVKAYIYEVDNMPQDQPISSFIGFRGTNSKMVGLSDQFQRIKTDLIVGLNRLYAIYGTAGIGKTTLAMQIYQDPDIQSKFECRAWVTVGRVPQPFHQISRGIIAQLSGLSTHTEGDEEIGDSLKRILHGKKCLVVLDDVWEMQIEDFLRHSSSYMKIGCIHVLLTGRHRKLIKYGRSESWYEVRFLNDEESMELLCEKVFGDESCPPRLHKAAIKIAKLCEGLPLMILTVASILSKSEHIRDPVYWNEVAEKRNSVFADAYNEISKVLFPSYNYLPQRLKMPFLFMGVFPHDYDTPAHKIIVMLTAEGLWYVRECLRELAFDYSLVLRILKSVDKTSEEFFVSEYKACWLHSSWRYVCRVEACKNMFYHVLNKLIDAEEEGLKGLHGLCLENNMLFGIKKFCNSVRSNCASSTRSLLFYGPYHQYPIHINVGFRLLREIDALTQRFYTFPTEILSLVQLKYLALTCNGELPSTISRLFNLRVLIIHPHMSIRRCGAPSYIPVQMWDIQELEHIEILGKSLVVPSHVDLHNLSTLIGVNASICTVLELSNRIPNIKKLDMHIELTPSDEHDNLLSCFGCISTLESLETLKFCITNPVVKYGHVFPVSPRSLKLPRFLRKLHLSGIGFPWEYMDAIGYLPYLQVLKLRSYAFEGSKWEAQTGSFFALKFLLIEDSDLVQWTPGLGSFPELTYLSMKHCYKLKEIQGRPGFLDQFPCTIEIELVDCNPLVLIWANQLQPCIGIMLRVIASSFFDEKPTTFKCERYGGYHIAEQERLDKEENKVDDFEEIANRDDREEANGDAYITCDTEGEGANEDITEERVMAYTRTIMRLRKKIMMKKLQFEERMVKMRGTRKRMLKKMVGLCRSNDVKEQ